MRSVNVRVQVFAIYFEPDFTCIVMKDQQPLNSQNCNCGANHDPNLG
jgi:hypothetical protein